MEVRRDSQSDRIHEYLKAQGNKDNANEPIQIKNVDNLREQLIAAIKESVDDYLKISPENIEPNLLDSLPVDDWGYKKLAIPLREIIFEGPPRLKLVVNKAFKLTSKNEVICPTLFIEIKDGNTNIGEFALRDYGDEFRLSHRKVKPEYRGSKNGIANIGMQAFEEFIREYVKRVPSRKPVIEANAAQLDVISWFLRNGFETNNEPFTVHLTENDIKIHDLEAILSSLENHDGQYVIGPYNYVFPSSFEGPYMINENDIPENVNMDESALIHLRKTIDIDNEEIAGQQVSDIQRKVKAQIT